MSSFGKRTYRFFLKSVTPKSRKPLRPLFRLFQIAAIALVVVLILDLTMLTTSTSRIGEFGDFFGGVLNPILTFLTFMGLLITIVIQQNELSDSRNELRRSADSLRLQTNILMQQRYESTFFNTLNLRADLVQAIDIQDSVGKQKTGRDCFVIFYERLGRSYRGIPNSKDSEKNILEKSKAGFLSFWRSEEGELAHFFRNISAVLALIDKDSTNNPFYADFFRSQMSNEELLLVFYFCLSELPGSSALKELVQRHRMLIDIPREKLLESDHQQLLDFFVRSREGRPQLQETRERKSDDTHT